MGEIADMMLDGTMCPGCGEFLHDGDDGEGYPEYCSGCAPDYYEEETTTKCGQSRPTKTSCPHCDKLVKKAGLNDHINAVHMDDKLTMAKLEEAKKMFCEADLPDGELYGRSPMMDALPLQEAKNEINKLKIEGKQTERKYFAALFTLANMYVLQTNSKVPDCVEKVLGKDTPVPVVKS